MASNTNPNARLLRALLGITALFVALVLLFKSIEIYGAIQCMSGGGDVRLEGTTLRCYMDFSSWQPGQPVRPASDSYERIMEHSGAEYDGVEHRQLRSPPRLV